MWILMNNSYLSIVKNTKRKDSLLVRARIKGDIERIFPKAKVFTGLGTDYEYRAFLPKWVVSKAIKKSLERIDYDNFKNSIPLEDTVRHDIYCNVWGVLLRFQDKIKHFDFKWRPAPKQRPVFETHPLGYQLTKTVMKEDYEEKL